MSNRSVRRQSGRQAKGAKAGGAVLPRPRSSSGRAAPRRDGGSGSAGLRSWRPRFFMDIINELRKVAWPSREDIIHLTGVVVVVTIILGAVLGAIDIGFGWFIDNTLLR